MSMSRSGVRMQFMNCTNCTRFSAFESEFAVVHLFAATGHYSAYIPHQHSVLCFFTHQQDLLTAATNPVMA